MNAKDQRIADIKEKIPEITVSEAKERFNSGVVLLDVRESEEVAQGSPIGALRMGRGFLEFNIGQEVPDTSTPIMVMCQSGMRSLFAADSLNLLGYTNIISVKGGFNQWKNEGHPFETPPTLDADARERYARHLTMPNVGEKGQLKLMNAKVLCIGAGGIGSPVAMYLAAAGVGTLGIVDHDVVDRSNLQRQILHRESTIGIPKVESAKQTLAELNPSVKVVAHQEHIDADNVEKILSQYDIVVDGSDNIPTRYLINDACVQLGIPNVHGAVFRFEGQVTVFWPGRKDAPGPCYRCLFPKPSSELVLSCSQAGVIGVLPGVIGLLQAVEAVKVILEIGNPLVGRMMYYDALEGSTTELKMKRNAECPVCSENATWTGYHGVDVACDLDNK